MQAVQAKQVGKSSGVKSTKLLTYNQQQTQGRGFAWAALRMKPDAVLVLPTDSIFMQHNIRLHSEHNPNSLVITVIALHAQGGTTISASTAL